RVLFRSPELKRLPEVITHGPVLDHLAVLESPDVDLLGGELLAGGRPAEELAEVAAVHGHARHDLVALADLVLDVGAHRPPQAAQPADRFLEALRPLGVAGRRLVIDEVGMDQLVSGVEVSLLEELLEELPRDPLVLLRHRSSGSLELLFALAYPNLI